VIRAAVRSAFGLVPLLVAAALVLWHAGERFDRPYLLIYVPAFAVLAWLDSRKRRAESRMLTWRPEPSKGAPASVVDARMGSWIVAAVMIGGAFVVGWFAKSGGAFAVTYFVILLAIRGGFETAERLRRRNGVTV